MKYQRLKTFQDGAKYSFKDLSKMALFNSREPLTEAQYQFLQGRLFEAKTDILTNGEYLFTTAGSEGNRFLIKLHYKKNWKN